MVKAANDTDSSGRVKSQILEAAIRIAQRSEYSPSQVKTRLGVISGVLAVGFVSTISVLGVAVTGVVESEPARLLVSFLLLGSLAVVLVASLALVVVVWNAYVSEYALRLEADEEATAATQEALAIEEALCHLGEDKEFKKDVTHLIAAELAAELNVEITDVQVSKICHQKAFDQSLSGCVSESIHRMVKIPGLYMEKEKHKLRSMFDNNNHQLT